jgi:hypothetical protein
MMAVLRTIRHQVWTDTKGLWLYLAVWAAAMAAQASVVVIDPVTWVDVRRGMPYSPDILAMTMRVIVTVVLTVLVIHRDPAVGTTAFWRTRPISGGTMWASKVAWIALWVVGAPAAVTFVLFTGLGLGMPDAAYGGLLVAFDQAMVAGIVLLAAAVTDTIAHFIVAGFAGVAIYAAAMTMLQKPLRALLPQIEATGGWTPQAIWSVLMCLGGIAALAIAYQTRRLAVTAALIGVVLCSTMVALTSIHWTWGDWTPRPANVRMAGSEKVTVSLVQDSIWVGNNGQDGERNGPKQISLYGNLDVSGAPPDVMFSVIGLRSTLHVPRSGDIPWQTSGGAWIGEQNRGTATVDGQPFRSMRMALGGSEIVIPAGSAARVPATALTGIPEGTFQRVVELGAGLDAQVTLRAYRYTAATRMPLKPGATARVGRSPMTVTAVNRSFGAVVVTIRTAVVSGPRGSLLELGNAVVLYNQARKVGIYRTQARISSVWMNFGLFFDRIGTETRRLEFTPGPDSVKRLGLDDQWFAGAELVFLGTEELGTVTRPLKITGLKLNK